MIWRRTDDKQLSEAMMVLLMLLFSDLFSGKCMRLSALMN